MLDGFPMDVICFMLHISAATASPMWEDRVNSVALAVALATEVRRR